MRAATLLKWTAGLLLCTGFGIVLGVRTGEPLWRMRKVEASFTSTNTPVIQVTDQDYHAVEGSVPEFAQWAYGVICTSFEQRFSPAEITPERRKDFYNNVVEAAVNEGELDAVVEGCTLRAINTADTEESVAAQHQGRSHEHVATIIVYGERAEYFGQDAWCFLCLSTADRQHGTARSIVVTCSPNYGLLHTQVVNKFGQMD